MRLKQVSLVVLVFLCISFMLYAQPCIDASGQTKAFNLAPGAKAAWNNTISGISHQPLHESKNQSGISVCKIIAGNNTFNLPTIKTGSIVNISIFSIAGKKMGVVTTTGQNSGELKRTLPQGIYLARIEVKGEWIISSRFVVGR